ncbi:hypothetical protein [Indioceanicola profundi]|uniref:hypothetical protein n=1 Tax=Indioceanicola profundi TaxID=2220096 RepID=UPI0013C4672A|nr:hypothetical protein [Indioceanicola profundi]
MAGRPRAVRAASKRQEEEIEAIRREAEESIRALEEGRVVDGRSVVEEMRAKLREAFGR